MRSFSESYRDAGVNIEAGYEGVKLMKKHVQRTMIPGGKRLVGVIFGDDHRHADAHVVGVEHVVLGDAAHALEH